MTWNEYQHAGLVRLALRLREHARDLADVDGWLARCGRPPIDPLRGEVAAIARRLAALIEDVREPDAGAMTSDRIRNRRTTAHDCIPCTRAVVTLHNL